MYEITRFLRLRLKLKLIKYSKMNESIKLIDHKYKIQEKRGWANNKIR